MKRWLKAIYDDLEESNNVERFEKKADMIAFAIVEEYNKILYAKKLK